jgi:hypothetical protein
MDTRATFRIGLLSLGAWLAGCATVPSGPPEEVAPRIVAALDEADEDEAEELFDRAGGRDARERLYPLLYSEAEQRYERGESAGAARVLRFMAPRYERARAVREALVYSLFLERARAEEPPPPELLVELETQLGALRAAGGELPHWVALVEAQLAVDRGQAVAALEALERFHASWDGEPEMLGVYVDDLERHLSAHL